MGVIDHSIETISNRIYDLYHDRHRENIWFTADAKQRNLELGVIKPLAKLLLGIENQVEPTITNLQDFESEYNSKHLNFNVDVSALIAKQWVRIVGGRVFVPRIIQKELRNINSSSPSELDFLKRFIHVYNRQTQERILNESILKRVLSAYELDLLISSELLERQQVSGNLRLNLTGERLFLTPLCNELFASCWLQLLENDNYDSDLTRIKKVIQTFIEFELTWPYSVWTFLGYNNLNRLQAAALNFIMSEVDFLDNKNEVQKIWLDRSDYSRINLNVPAPDIELNTDNCYDLLCEIDSVKSDYHFLLEQSESRSAYVLATRLILDNPPGMIRNPDFPLRRRLLILMDPSRPFICWKTFEAISKDFLEYSPLLLNDIELAPISFMILSTAYATGRYSHGKENRQFLDRMTSVWLESFDALLTRIAQENTPKQEIERCVSRILHSEIKSTIVNSVRVKYDLHTEHKKRYEGAIDLLKNTVWRFQQPQRRIITSIISGVFRELKEIWKFDLSQHSIPNWRLILCSDLVKLSQVELNEGKFDDGIGTQCAEFIIDVSEYLTEQLISFFSFNRNKKKIGNIFSIGIESVDWYTIYMLIFQHGSIHDLFDKVLSTQNTDKTGSGGVYEERNIQVYSLLRLFCKSLALALEASEKPRIHKLNGQVLNVVEYGAVIHDKVETLIKKYCKNDLPDDCIDILKFEKSYSSVLYERELLEIVVKAFNIYPDKTNGLETVIIHTNSIHRLLIISNNTTQSKVLDLIVSKINELSVEGFIEGASFDQKKYALIEAVNSPRFSSIAGPLIAKLESWLESPGLQMIKSQNSNFLFEVKLLYLFKSGNREDLERLEPPKADYKPDQDNYLIRKKFYAGLYQLYHDRDYSLASITFGDLVFMNPNNFEYQFRLFDARTKRAWKMDSYSDLKDALNDWELFIQSEEGRREMSNSHLKYHIDLISIFHYVKNNQQHLIEHCLSRLPDYMKYQEELLELLVPYYEMTGQLLSLQTLLLNATKLYGGQQSEYPAILRISLNGLYSSKNLQEIKKMFSEIREMSPEAIVQVVPDDLNGKRTLGDFILQEILNAGLILIEKIRALDSINDENKYNDLLQSILRARLAVWNWEIPDQARAGQSYSKNGEISKDLGSPDFVLRSAGNSFAVIEPMVLNTSNTLKITEHVTKPLDYLDHGKLFYIITYDTGRIESYATRWDSYKTKVKEIKYPDSVKIINSEFDDFTETYNLRNVKVGRTYHKGGIIISHIFFKISEIK